MMFFRADGRNRGGVDVDVERRPLQIEPGNEFGGNMLRIRRAAAVAAERELVTIAEGGEEGMRSIRNSIYRHDRYPHRLLPRQTSFTGFSRYPASKDGFDNRIAVIAASDIRYR